VTDLHINGSVLCVLCKNVAEASLFEYVKQSVENKKKTEEPDKFLKTVVAPHLMHQVEESSSLPETQESTIFTDA